MRIEIDHLVVAARTLEEGAAWLESRLGVPTAPGGRHATMATHNRLLSLGPGRYVEVIAADPDAAPPSRPRWFDLDAPEMVERLEQGPALIHWVARSDDIRHAVGATAQGKPDILAMSRGEFRWRIAVPPSGRLALRGTAPTIIQWEGRRPSEALPETGCRLEALVLCHPEAEHMLHALHEAGLSRDDPVEARAAGGGLRARIRTPRGIVELGE